MIVRDMTTSPVEEERVIIDKQTAQSTYQTGYSYSYCKKRFQHQAILCRCSLQNYQTQNEYCGHHVTADFLMDFVLPCIIRVEHEYPKSCCFVIQGGIK